MESKYLNPELWHQRTLDDIECIYVKRSPICIDISPIAQVALLQTEINSGFKFVPSTGIKSAAGGKASSLRTTTHELWFFIVYQHGLNVPMHGLTCWKQALVRSPSRAKELCLTSGILSWTTRIDIKCWAMTFILYIFLRIAVCLTSLHLHALVHEGEDVATSNQLLNGASQTLS